MWPNTEMVAIFGIACAAGSMFAVGIIAGQIADLGPQMSKRDFRLYMAGLACCVVAMWLLIGLLAYTGVL